MMNKQLASLSGLPINEVVVQQNNERGNPAFEYGNPN